MMWAGREGANSGRINSNNQHPKGRKEKRAKTSTKLPNQMSSAHNIELHTTFGVRDTLASLKDEIARLEQLENTTCPTYRSGHEEQSSVDGDKTNAVTSISNSNNGSQFFPSAVTDRTLASSSLSTLPKRKTAEEIVTEDDQRAAVSKAEASRLFEEQETAAAEAARGRVAKAVLGRDDGENEEEGKKDAEEDQHRSQNPTDRSATTRSHQGKHDLATNTSTSFAGTRNPIINGAEEIGEDSRSITRRRSMSIDASSSNGGSGNTTRALRISAASHIRVDTYYISLAMAAKREQEKLEEALIKETQKKAVDLILESINAQEKAGRGLIEEEWFAVGFSIGTANSSPHNATSSCTYGGVPTSPLAAGPTADKGVTRGDQVKEESKKDESITIPIIPSFAELAVTALLSPPLKQKQIFDSDVYYQRRKAVQRYLADSAAALGSITFREEREESEAEKGNSDVDTASYSYSSSSSHRLIDKATANATDKCDSAELGLSAAGTIISIAESFYLCAVVAEEATQRRLQDTQRARRAAEWAEAEEATTRHLDSVLAAEAKSYSTCTTPAPNNTSTKREGAPSTPFSKFDFSHTNMRYGYGANNVAQHYPFPQPLQQSGSNHNSNSNNNNNNNSGNRYRYQHSHPLAFYSNSTDEAEKEAQRAARAQLNAAKWRSRVFDDEVTRAVYYAASGDLGRMLRAQ